MGCLVNEASGLAEIAERLAAAWLAAGHAWQKTDAWQWWGLPAVMTLEDLAALLQLHIHTLRADLSRRPESLPPRLYLPGRSSVRFLAADVVAWLLACKSPQNSSGVAAQAAEG